MDGSLVLAVPEAVDAIYAVPGAPGAGRDLADRLDEVVARLPDPTGPAVRRFLDDGTCTVQVLDVGDTPLHQPGFLSPDPDSRDAIEQAEEVVVCVSHAAPEWPPTHQLAARGLAVALAVELRAPLVDATLRKVLDAEALHPTLASPSAETLMLRWITLYASLSEAGLWMTSKGLSTFGLPELQVMDVPPDLAAAWGAVMNGLALNLVRWWVGAIEGPEPPAFVERPAVLELTNTDVTEANGWAQPPAGRSARVQLDLEPHPGRDSFFNLAIPDSDSASASDSTEHLSARMCRELFG